MNVKTLTPHSAPPVTRESVVTVAKHGSMNSGVNPSTLAQCRERCDSIWQGCKDGCPEMN